MRICTIYWRDWGQEKKWTTEDEMAGWHHWLDGRESEWTPWDGEGQGGLACCDSWGGKELDMTERLNWTELNWTDWVIFHFICIPHFFIHSHVNKHLGGFRVLAIVNSAAVNIGVYVSFSIMVYSGCMPSSRTVGSYSSFIPIFLRNLHSGCFNLHSH